MKSAYQPSLGGVLRDGSGRCHSNGVGDVINLRPPVCTVGPEVWGGISGGRGEVFLRWRYFSLVRPPSRVLGIIQSGSESFRFIVRDCSWSAKESGPRGWGSRFAEFVLLHLAAPSLAEGGCVTVQPLIAPSSPPLPGRRRSA